jgi:hypothetical protein
LPKIKLESLNPNETLNEEIDSTRLNKKPVKIVGRKGNRREASISKVVATIDAGIISASKVIDLKRIEEDEKRTCNSVEAIDDPKPTAHSNKPTSRTFKPSKKSQGAVQSGLQVLG